MFSCDYQLPSPAAFLQIKEDKRALNTLTLSEGPTERPSPAPQGFCNVSEQLFSR